MSKRKLPRRELPWLSTLLDKMSYSKLPTNGVVLRRLMFEMERQSGATSLSTAAVTVRDELVKLWEHAGYGDILKDGSNIMKQITSLHESYKKLCKTPVSRRSTESFKNKESEFTKSLEKLFDCEVPPLIWTDHGRRQGIPTLPLGEDDQLYAGLYCKATSGEEACPRRQIPEVFLS